MTPPGASPATATEPVTCASLRPDLHLHVCQECLDEGHTAFEATYTDICTCEFPARIKPCRDHEPWPANDDEPDAWVIGQYVDERRAHALWD